MKTLVSNIRHRASSKTSPATYYLLPATNQRGVVSLITSIIVSLLLSVITLSGVGIMNSELRQATDFDLSVKAYFAAESGLEDAIAEIRRQGVAAAVASKPAGCAPYNATAANLSGDGRVAYTCQLVNLEQTELVGELAKEGSLQVDLAGLDFTSLKISWNQEGSSDPGNWNEGSIPPQFPPADSWSDQYPSILETTIVSYPQTSSFDSDQITSLTKVLKPSSGGSSSPINIQTPANPELVQCEPASVAGSYECQVTLQNPPANRHHVLRLHARYSSAHYKIEAFQGSNQVDIPNTQLVVDVTGKAGDVFRRIQAKSFLTQSTPLPFVVLTDESICKVFDVVGTSASSETGCGP